MGGFSLVGLKVKHSRWLLRSHGLQSRVIELDNYGCNIHFWAPSSPSPCSSNCNFTQCGTDNIAGQADPPSSCSSSSLSSNHNTTAHGNAVANDVPTCDAKQFDACLCSSSSKPALVFLHGFGGDGTMAWENQVGEFSKHFSLYLPDLLFFGNSTIAADNLDGGHRTHTECEGSSIKEQQKQKVRYSEIFQAKCMHQAMNKLGVREATVVGHSYGGFVAYQMAHLYPSFVKRIVIVGAGITMNPHSNDALLRKLGATRIHDMLVPPTLSMFIKSLQVVFNDYLPPWFPSFLYRSLFESLKGDQEGRLQLVDDIILGKEGAPPLPTIHQSALILWGEKDQIFDIALAHELKEFLGAKATLFTMKGVGHMPHMVKPKEFNKSLLSFLGSQGYIINI